MPDSVLSVRGDKIVDGSGQPVILRGYNIGGWMNMENFLTGYPGTESQHRRVLRKVLGPELYDAFFDRFITVFFGDADARYLASLGMNSVRIPFNYRHFEDDARPFELKESGSRCWTARSGTASSTACTRSLTSTRCLAHRTSTGTATTRRTRPGSGSTGTSRTASCTCGKPSPHATGATPRWPATTS